MKKPETFYEEFDTFQEKTILNSNPNVQFKKSGKIESDLNQIYSIEYDFDQWDFEVIIKLLFHSYKNMNRRSIKRIKKDSKRKKPFQKIKK